MFKIFQLPSKIFLLITSEFCERFGYYGFRSILILFLTEYLRISSNKAKSYYHAYAGLCNFSTLIGACMSDFWIGKLRTLISMSVLHMIGSILLTLTTMPYFGAPTRLGSMLSLILIGIGSGGIRPCASPFGAEQIPKDKPYLLSTYFSMYYTTVNVGALTSTLITPILRADVSCFGHDCYAAAFGTLTILMTIAVVFLFIGTPFFIDQRPDRKQLSECISCTWSVIKHCSGRKALEKKECSDKQYHEIKHMAMITMIFFPLPIYWSLFDQIASTWTLQAIEMDGNLGKVTIKPDQVQSVNSLLVILLVPFFDGVIYPLLAKVKLLTRPLHRIAAGLFFAVMAFLCAFGLEKVLQSNRHLNLDTGLTVANLYPCNMFMGNETLEAYQQYPVFRPEYLTTTFRTNCSHLFSMIETIPKSALSSSNVVVIHGNQSRLIIDKLPLSKSPRNSKKAKVRLIVIDGKKNHTVQLIDKQRRTWTVNLIANIPCDYLAMDPSTYWVISNQDGYSNTQATFNAGLAYTLMLYPAPDGTVKVMMIGEINVRTISVLWQLPQYLMITISEIMVVITGMHYVFDEAPTYLRAMMFAFWNLNIAVGNILVTVLSHVHVFHRQDADFMFYAALMLVGSVVFAIIARCQDKQVEKTGKKEIVATEQPGKIEVADRENNEKTTSENAVESDKQEKEIRKRTEE